jgi:hypothetical protein
MEEESDGSVKVLKISANGPVTPHSIYEFDDVNGRSKLIAGSDNYYLRELGVYFWYDGYAQQKNLRLNIYCSVLAGFPVHGEVLVIGDITKGMRRSPNFQDLLEDWFDQRVLEVISIVNMDEQVLELVTGLFQ